MLPPYQRFDVIDSRHINILLAEDNEGDVELLREQFEASSYPHTLFVVSDGQHAVDFLNHYTTLPDIVVMDINMPRLSGLELLKIMQEETKFTTIPTAVVTSSEASPDIEIARECGANGYIIKPDLVTPEDLKGLIDVALSVPNMFIKVGGK